MISNLSGLSVQMTNALRESNEYLKMKHNWLTAFGSIEELVCDGRLSDSEDENDAGCDSDPNSGASEASAVMPLDPRDRDALVHHIARLRAGISRALWSEEYYVSTSLLDEFVLHAAKAGVGDVPGEVIANLATAGADQNGFVLYPLIGFKMKTPMLPYGESRLRTEAVFRRAGFAVSLQTNSNDDAIACVKRLARRLGIRQRIDDPALLHFARTVPWFGKNPLMLVRLKSHTLNMYENQFVYTLKIRLAAAHLLMLHTLSAEIEARIEREGSAIAGANNFSTLDIRHYAIGEAIRGHPIQVIRVPMNVSTLELARLSDVSAVLASDVLAKPIMKRHDTRISAALRNVERGHFRHVTMASNARPERRLYGRLVTALDWFRQSFSARANEAEATVAIAVALETLLTDHFAPKIIERLRRRMALCMSDATNLTICQNSVEAVYKARSEIVHTGTHGRKADIYRAQLSFIDCFCGIAERLPGCRLARNGTLGHLIGDVVLDDASPASPS